MMEIKFRAWDKFNNIFLWFDKTTGGKFHGFRNVTYPNKSEMYIDWILVERETSIEQFTGLKDENGVDIYDGDIVHLPNRGPNIGVTGQVIYKNAGAVGWRVFDFNKDRYSCFLNSNDIIRVVGNIHEGTGKHEP